MRVLGCAVKTAELTQALGSEIIDGVGYESGHVDQRLERSGLVERVDNDSLTHGSYRLTRKGGASVVDRYFAPPTRPELQARIEQGTCQ